MRRCAGTMRRVHVAYMQAGSYAQAPQCLSGPRVRGRAAGRSRNATRCGGEVVVKKQAAPKA
eukprot:scaffold38791_cov258-Isochrysis_galbana.AAC.2